MFAVCFIFTSPVVLLLTSTALNIYLFMSSSFLGLLAAKHFPFFNVSVDMKSLLNAVGGVVLITVNNRFEIAVTSRFTASALY